MMKKIIFLTVIITSFFSTQTSATSLVGTSSIVYQSSPYLPNKSDSVTGFVRLNDGFTAPFGGAVIMDTITSVSGLMYGTEQRSTVTLNDNLKLSSQASLSGAFGVSGQGNIIFLDGDLTLPANKIINFITDTVIDGCGNTLTFTDYSQLLIENDVTLTLRNINIKTTHTSFTRPCIRGQNNTSRLALDNVVLALSNNFDFRHGRFFIHNSVRITGTSQFVYRSTQASYITPGALLTFDPNTTLYYYPSSTAPDLIRLANKSAGLYFNHATLQTTHTGMVLSKGRLWLDNKVTLSTQADNKLLSFTQEGPAVASTSVQELAWRHDNQFLAVAANAGGGPHLLIYRKNAASLTLVTSIIATPFRTVKWSPSGKFLAVGGFSSTSAQPQLQIFRFNGTTLTLVATYNYTTFLSTNGITSISWHPSEQFLAAVGFPDAGVGDAIQILSFDQESSLTLLTSDNFGGTPVSPGAQDVSWTSDGSYLLVVGTPGGVSTSGVVMYNFYGFGLTALDSKSITTGQCCSIRPDNQFVAVGFNTTSNDTQVYSWNGSSFGPAINYNVGNIISTVKWSPDGQYLAIGGSSSAVTFEMEITSFNGSTISLVTSVSPSARPLTSDWTPDGAYLTFNAQGVNFFIYNMNYSFNDNAQAITNGLTLGKASEGSSSNLSTYILGDARVDVAGILVDESI